MAPEESPASPSVSSAARLPRFVTQGIQLVHSRQHAALSFTIPGSMLYILPFLPLVDNYISFASLYYA